MDRTIKQIADELKVSKQAIRQRINKLSNDCYYVGSNKTIYVTDKGYKILTEKVSSGTNKNTANIDTSIEALIKQLAIKDEQIKKLQELLENEQKLNAINVQKIEELEDKQTKHKGLLSKLFRKS